LETVGQLTNLTQTEYNTIYGVAADVGAPFNIARIKPAREFLVTGSVRFLRGRASVVSIDSGEATDNAPRPTDKGCCPRQVRPRDFRVTLCFEGKGPQLQLKNDKPSPKEGYRVTVVVRHDTVPEQSDIKIPDRPKTQRERYNVRDVPSGSWPVLIERGIKAESRTN